METSSGLLNGNVNVTVNLDKQSLMYLLMVGIGITLVAGVVAAIVKHID